MAQLASSKPPHFARRKVRPLATSPNRVVSLCTYILFFTSAPLLLEQRLPQSLCAPLSRPRDRGAAALQRLPVISSSPLPSCRVDADHVRALVYFLAPTLAGPSRRPSLSSFPQISLFSSSSNYSFLFLCECLLPNTVEVLEATAEDASPKGGYRTERIQL